ncbi:hydrocephalus-inducing protein homolog [Discoglossus pictus]
MSDEIREQAAMPVGELQEPLGSIQEFRMPSGFKSKVLAPRNPKLTTDEGPVPKLIPSIFLKEMSLTTEEKLANTREMQRPPITHLLDMSETTHQKFSSVDLDQAIFQPFPSGIFFQNYTACKRYEVPLVLRNNDKVPRLVKVIQETSPYFQIISPTDVCHKVAPGMASTFRIVFTPEENKDYSHDLICITEREKFVVPIRAVGARALLDFPDEVNFNVCPVKYKSQKTLLVRNIGNREAHFELITESPFSVDPVSGSLEIGESMQIFVDFQPREEGDHIQDMIIRYDTGEDVYMSLYGAATDVNIRLDKSSLTMEKTYLSMANQRSVIISNHSDIIAHFKWKRNCLSLMDELHKKSSLSDLKAEGEKSMELFLDVCNADPQVRERAMLTCRAFYRHFDLMNPDSPLFEDDIFHIEPEEGELWPNMTVEVRVVFKPQAAKLYESLIYLDITGRASRLPLKIRGEGLGPKLRFNIDQLEIGKVFAGAMHCYEVILANQGAIDGIFTLVPPTTAVGSSFTFSPSEGIILPNGHQAIVMLFSCRLLGEFCEEFHFRVDGSPETIHFTIRGCIIGPTFHFSLPSLNFGDVSFGFPSTMSCSIHNTSLVSMNFKLRIPGDCSGEPSISSSSQVLDSRWSSWRKATNENTGHQEFNITPSQGTIRSLEAVDIEVSFCSNNVKMYDLALVVDVEGIGEEVLALPITARCVVPSLHLEDCVLQFNRCFLQYPYKKSFTIVNPSSLPACYGLLPQECHASPGVLYKSPRPRGIIEPRSIVQVPIVLEAQDTGVQSIKAQVAVFGSNEPVLEMTLLCTGEGPVVHVFPSELDFGEIQVLTDVSRTLCLSNQSLIPALFQATMARKCPLWSVDPDCGEIPPEGEVYLTLVAHLDDTVRFKNKIQLTIENSNTYNIPLRATGVGTTIVTDREFGPVLNLGTHFSAGPCEYSFTMSNLGRRTQQLHWTMGGFSPFRKRSQLPSIKSSPSLTSNTQISSPVFKLSPSRMELSPGQSINVVLEGFSETPKVVKEKLLGYTIMGKQTGKELIMTVDVICEFIAPVLQLSTKQLHFYVEKGPEVELTRQCQPLIMKNVSALPLKVSLSLRHPFSITNNESFQAEDSQSHLIAVGEEMELLIGFDPTYIQDLRSRVKEETLIIQYAEHPHTDYVSLLGEVHFPNLHLPVSHIDFGCIQNNTDASWEMDITNCSPLPVQYEWSCWEAIRETETQESEERSGGTSAEENVKDESGDIWVLSGLPDDPDQKVPLLQELGTGACTVSSAFVLAVDQKLINPVASEEKHVPSLVSDLPVLEQVFNILPLGGNLQSGERQTVHFTFHGHPNISMQAMAKCMVHGGPTYEISLQGEASDINYTLNTNNVDFGLQLMDKVAEADILLTNTGRVSFPFTVLNQKTESIETARHGEPVVHPISGSINPGEEKILKVFYFPGIPESFQHTIQIQVAQLAPESIVLRGEGVFPRICLDLPRIISGDESLQPYLQKAEENLRGKKELCARPTMTTEPGDPEFLQEISNTNMNTLLMMEVERLLIKDHARDQLQLEMQELDLQRTRSKLLKASLPDYLLDFGFVILGDIHTNVVKITNTGHFPVSFHSDRRGLSGTGFSTGLDRVKNLPCIQTETFQVKFDPRSANINLGNAEAEMSIQVSGGPRLSIWLRATVTMPSLSLSTNKVEFGAVQCGQCHLRSIQLYNEFPVACEWNVLKQMKDTQIDKHLPKYLRKRLQQDSKPKSVTFDIIPPSGILLPGQSQNVEIRFMPQEEKPYSQRLMLQVAKSSQHVVLLVQGQGMEPRLDFTPSVLQLGPVLPFSHGDEAQVLVRNPCSFPIEVYSLEMDKQYLEEEKILRMLKGYDEQNSLLLPPRLPGEKLPTEIVEYYEEQKRLKEDVNRTRVIGDKKDPESDLGEIKELSGLGETQEHSSTQHIPSNSSHDKKSGDTNEGSGKGGESGEKVSSESFSKPVGELQVDPVSQLLAKNMGFDPIGESLESRNCKGISIVMYGAPLSGKSSAAVALAKHYSIACLTIDSVVLEAISDGNSRPGQKARLLCAKAAVEHAQRVSDEADVVHPALSMEALAKHTAEGGQAAGTKSSPPSNVSRGKATGKGKESRAGSKADSHTVSGGKPDIHVVPGSKPVCDTSGSPSGRTSLPGGPIPQRLSVSEGEHGLMSCVLPEDLLQEILKERLQLSDCFNGVIFDGLETLFAQNVMSTLRSLLIALNNRKHIYFINLWQDYEILKTREEARRQQEEQEQLHAQMQESIYMKEMDEEEYDNLPANERARIDELRVTARRQHRKRLQEERLAREEKERKLKEELLRQKMEEELRKKNRKGKGRDSGKEDMSGKRSQVGGKQGINVNTGKLDQRLDSALQRKVSIKDRPESVVTETDEANKKKKIKGGLGDPPQPVVVQDDLMIEPLSEREKQLIQSFKKYESFQKELQFILNFWDRVQGILLPPVEDSPREIGDKAAEHQGPSSKKYIKDLEHEKLEKERLEREKKERENTKEDAESGTAPEMERQEDHDLEIKKAVGVPYFSFQVSDSPETSGEKILQSGKLPSVQQIIEDLGFGRFNHSAVSSCYFSIVQYPEMRTESPNQEILSHFTFIAAFPDDPNVIVEEKKEADPETDATLSVPTPKEEQMTPTKSRNRKEKTADTEHESRDRRRSASVRKGQQTQETHSPPPEPTTPMPDGDQSSTAREAPKDKLIRLGKFRWIVPAGGEVPLRIYFGSNTVGNFDQTLNFELVGTRRRYQVYCRGICSFPTISQNPKIVFPHRKKDVKPNEIIQKKFVLSTGTFDFGPLLCGKSRDKYKAGQFPENMEKITICNESPMVSEIGFCFQHDVKAVTFILDPPTMNLKPNEKQELSIWAYPTSAGLFQDNLICCVKDNPEPVIFHICCRGVRPELELDRKQIHFDKILLHRKETKTVFLRNSNLLPVAWHITGLENLGDDFSISQDQGIVGPRSECAVQLHFKAAKATNIKKNIRLEVSDVENILGIVQLENIQVVAEAYDVALDISFPKGTDGCLDFGVVKVNEESKHNLSLKNKGKYEIGFSFTTQAKGSGMPDLSSIFSIVPQKGTLGPNDRGSQVQILFHSKEEVSIFNKPILRCQVIDPTLREGGETIASIPIRMTVRSVFAKYRLCPTSEINFGAMVLGSRKICTLTLENCGYIEFRYNISKLVGDMVIQPVKKGPVHDKKRARSREDSGSSKSVGKGKRADPLQRDANIGGQAHLSLGMFTIAPGFGVLPPGGHQVINVECFTDQLGTNEELLAIDISDKNPEDHPSGIPYRLTAEACTPGFVTDDIGSIFEEHRIVVDARMLQCSPALQEGGVYLQQENRFLFCNVIVGQTSTARFKIMNTGRVPCDVALTVRPVSTKSAARISDIFEVSPQRMNIPSHGHCFARVTFSPQNMQTYQCIFEATVEGVGSAITKTSNLTFDISGDGNLPRVTVLRPVLRNRSGSPLLLFQRLLIGHCQQLPLVLKNDGSIPAQLQIDLPGDGGDFTLKPKPNTNCIYPSWSADGSHSAGNRAHTAAMILHPGDTAEFDVLFRPTSAQRCETLLRLSVQGNQYEYNSVQLVGEGYQEDLTLDNIHSPGEASIPEGSLEDGVVQAARSDHINFGDCHVGEQYQVTFTMTNHRQEDSMRFEWPSGGPLLFSPQVGHIHAGCAKDVTVTLKSDEIVALSRFLVKCQVSRISFVQPLDKVTDWDDCMRTVRWVDAPQPPAPINPRRSPQRPISQRRSPQRSSSQHLSPQHPISQVPALQMPISQSPVSQRRIKQKVIETDPEPAHVVLGEGSRELELLVSAIVDYAQYQAKCDPIQFKDTLLYQTRVYKYQIQNTGNVQMLFSWQLQMSGPVKSVSFAPGLQNDDRPATARTRFLQSRPVSVLESVTSLHSVRLDSQPFSIQPNNGIIPVGETQEFLIKFSPSEVGVFEGRLTCSIPNLKKEQQEPILPVKGHSLLPYCHFQLEDSDYISNGRRNPELSGPRGAPPGTTLDPNTRVIEFSTVGVGTKRTRSFSILNPTNKSYSFLWICDDPPSLQISPTFCCMTEHGLINPQKRVEVTFEFVSQVLDITESFWCFQIPEKNISVPFLLVGKASEPSVYLDRSHLNFRCLLIGHEVHETVYLINNEDKALNYSFHDCSYVPEEHSQILRVKPTEGTIAPLSRIPIDILIKPSKVGELNFNLVCDIKTKTKPLHMNVKAEGHLTDACIQCQDSTGKVTTLSIQTPNEMNLGKVDISDRCTLQFYVLNNGLFPFSFSCDLLAPLAVQKYLSISPDRSDVAPGQRIQSILTFEPDKKCVLKDTHLIIKIENGPEVKCSLSATAVSPGVHFSFTQHDFGMCFIHYAGMRPARKTLIVKNKEDHEISLDCLYKNTPHLEIDFCAQVLPPGGQIEIPISFYPCAGLLYQENVVFQMAGHSEVPIRLQGQGIELKVAVADPKLKVTNFGTVNMGKTVKKSVPIINNSMVPITCTILIAPSVLALQDPKVLSWSPTSEVTIAANGGMCKLELQFTPQSRIAPFAEEVILDCSGLPLPLFLLRGCSPGMELSLDQDYIPFGAVVLHSQATRRILLSNTGDLGARFQWDIKKFHPDFSISPTSGYIIAGAEVIFNVTFHPCEVKSDIHYENLICSVEGSKPLKLTLNGSCVGLPSTKEVIHFQCLVRSKHTQTILLSNKTHQSWKLNPIIDGEYWTGPDKVTVEAQQQKPYEITFHPLVMTQEGKKLEGSVFFPLPDGTGLLYLLQGVAEPPKSSGNIIREVPCKTSYTELLAISNWLNKPQRFRATVEMIKPDHLDCSTSIKGMDYVEVPAASRRDYRLTFHSHKEGMFSTKITFLNEVTKEYFFYYVTFKATPPGIISTIEMVAPVRQSTAATVKVENQLPVPVTFTTECRVPEINLPPQLIVPAQSEGSLMFEYQPLKAGESTGLLILQSNELGMYQYELLLKASPPLSEKPLYFWTTLGSNQTIGAKFINYTRQKTEYSCKIDNPDFHVEKMVVAAPGSQGGSEVSLDVTYEPIQLGESKAVLHISSPLGGEYKIPLFGSALEPKPQGPIQIRSGSNVTIPFKNVFLQTTAFTFQADNPAFTVKPCEPIRSKKTHHISVSFEAQHGGSKVPVTGKLIVSCPRATGIAQGIYWVYYLKGVVSEK